MASARRSALAVPELLSRILGFTIYQLPNSDRSVRRGDRKIMFCEPPWPFLLVCKHWQQVVLSAPALSAFVVILENFHFADTARILPVLKTHIHRLKSVPLTLAVSLYHLTSELGAASDLKLFRTFLQSLMDTQHRWRDVALDIRVWDDPRITKAHPPDLFDFAIRFQDTKALEHLSISFVAPGKQTLELALCPRLERLKLEFSVIVRNPPSTAGTNYFLNLSSIVLRLEFDNASNYWWTLLRLSPHVRHLKIESSTYLRDKTRY